MSDVIILSHKEAQENWWHTTVKCALQKTIKNGYATSIQNIWKRLVKSEDSLSVVL